MFARTFYSSIAVMSKKKLVKTGIAPKPEQTIPYPAAPTSSAGFPIGWLIGLLVLTGALFGPILGHQFTNWDDNLYVVNNALLHGPDWKGIFTQPVVSNYHPLTILSLAINYQVSELKPFSYFFINWALHIANTGLVFYLAWLLSGKIRWVALFTTLLFAIHPMHLESVAWISERKDVLYAFFYLLALLRYWRYLQLGGKADYWLTLAFFVLSLLSKPAAVVLPLTLLLLDYWKGRTFDRKVWLEKAPFFVLSLAMGVTTVLIQSQKAIASLDKYSVVDRLFLGSHSLVMYVVRFFVPTPLSAFHPYPMPGEWSLALWISPVLVLALAGTVWYFRKNKTVVFGALFYLANIILVVQFLAIGNTLLAERYTYVPYIGIAFALTMLLAQKIPATLEKPLQWGLLLVATLGLGFLSKSYIQTWKDTDALWTNAIRHFPDAAVPRANRANYYSQQAVQAPDPTQYNVLLKKALADCDAALAKNPNHYATLDIRSLILIRFDRAEEALADANTMIQVEPDNTKGYLLRGTANQRLRRFDEALGDFSRCLQKNPNDADALHGRGTALFNGKQMYREALADFDKTIALKPDDRDAYLNRSRCYLMLGDLDKARENAETAQKMGVVVPQDYWNLIKKPD